MRGLSDQCSNSGKPGKNAVGVWRICKLVGQILPRPMLIVLTIPPEPGRRQVINDAFVGTPDFVTILPIAQRQL